MDSQALNSRSLHCHPSRLWKLVIYGPCVLWNKVDWGWRCRRWQRVVRNRGVDIVVRTALAIFAITVGFLDRRLVIVCIDDFVINCRIVIWISLVIIMTVRIVLLWIRY